MSDFSTGQQFLAFPEIKRYVLVNTFSGDRHLVTENLLKDAFGERYYNVMSNRESGWLVEDYFE